MKNVYVNYACLKHQFARKRAQKAGTGKLTDIQGKDYSQRWRVRHTSGTSLAMFTLTQKMTLNPMSSIFMHVAAGADSRVFPTRPVILTGSVSCIDQLTHKICSLLSHTRQSATSINSQSSPRDQSVTHSVRWHLVTQRFARWQHLCAGEQPLEIGCVQIQLTIA